MFNIFGKKKAEVHTNQREVRGYIVPKTQIKKFEPKRFEPKRFEPKKFDPEKQYFKIKYRDTKTGEIFTIDLYDDEAFEKMMSNRHAQILFGD